MRWILAVLLLLGAAHAEPSVDALLMGYHGPPPKALLESSVPQVRAVAADRKAPAMRRANALQALAYWPDDATFFIWAEALAEPGDGLHKHRVLLLLGKTFGARALPHLRAFLDHEKPAFRLTAVEALGSVVGGAKALRARLVKEPNPHVRAAIQRRLDAPVEPGAVVR